MKNKLLIGFVFGLVLSISNVLAEESAEFVGIDARGGRNQIVVSGLIINANNYSYIVDRSGRSMSYGLLLGYKDFLINTLVCDII